MCHAFVNNEERSQNDREIPRTAEFHRQIRIGIVTHNIPVKLRVLLWIDTPSGSLTPLEQSSRNYLAIGCISLVHDLKIARYRANQLVLLTLSVQSTD